MTLRIKIHQLQYLLTSPSPSHSSIVSPPPLPSIPPIRPYHNNRLVSELSPETIFCGTACTLGGDQERLWRTGILSEAIVVKGK